MMAGDQKMLRQALNLINNNLYEIKPKNDKKKIELVSLDKLK